MASFLLLVLLLTLSTTTTTSAINATFTTITLTPTPSFTSQPPPPPPPSPPPPFSLLSHLPPIHHLQDSPQQLQFNTIIDSIVGAGDFGNWANLLAQADPSIIPLTATFFIPDDHSFLTVNLSPPPATSVDFIDPLLFPYHIVPRRFIFSELCQFPIGARLPTLLSGYTLLITNNSGVNFTINGAPLTRPNLFQSSAVSVHGIGGVLEYNVFGNDDSPPKKSPDMVESPPEKSPEMGHPPAMEFKQEIGPVVEYPKSSARSNVEMKEEWALMVGVVVVILLTTLWVMNVLVLLCVMCDLVLRLILVIVVLS